MRVTELKKVSYDPSVFMDIETVDEAVNIILTPEAGMTSKYRWAEETVALMEIMERHIARGSTVLDYGCGIGRMAKPLINKLGCSVVGVDISPNMRALAASCVDSPLFFALDPIMLSRLRPECCDAAVAIWALQHCLDLEAAIDFITSLVRSGGKLVILNNITRAVPVEGAAWADDGQNVDAMIRGVGFTQIERGQLDARIAPGWMKEGTFWAVYKRR